MINASNCLQIFSIPHPAWRMFVHVFCTEQHVVFVSRSEFRISNIAFLSEVHFVFVKNLETQHTTLGTTNFSSFKDLPGVEQRVALLAHSAVASPQFCQSSITFLSSVFHRDPTSDLTAAAAGSSKEMPRKSLFL